jgi:hypothetical protein
MKETATIIRECLGSTDNISRFAFFFTGEKVASYEVMTAFLLQAFDRQ